MVLLFDDGKRLEKAVGEEAAQIIVSLLERLGEEQKNEAASKADLRETELRLQKEIEMVRSSIKETELRLLKWQLGVGFAIVLVMAKGFGWIGF